MTGARQDTSAAAGSPHPGRRPWLAGIFLAIDVALLLVTLGFAHVTTAGPAERTLGESVAILTEVDTLLDVRYDSLRTAAEQPGQSTLTLPDFPLDITFTPSEVTETNRDQFRVLLLQRSANLLRDDGPSALRSDRVDDVDSTSPEGAVGVALDLLRPTPHVVFVTLTIAFALIAAALAIALVRTTEGYGGLVGLGLAILPPAALFLIAAVALRFILRVAADGTDDLSVRALLRLAQELDWAFIRDGAVFVAGSALLLVAGLLLGRWDGDRGPYQAGAARGETIPQ